MLPALVLLLPPPPVLLLLLSCGCVLPRAGAADGGAACTSGLDCQLNGVCRQRVCVCDAAWGGANCSQLKLLSPPSFTPSGFH